MQHAIVSRIGEEAYLAANAPTYYLESPCLTVEVLSESTERVDRGEKLRAYQQIDSLVEYLRINQEEREVEICRRTPQGWVRDILEPGETCALASVGMELTLDQIYEDSGVLS